MANNMQWKWIAQFAAEPATTLAAVLQLDAHEHAAIVLPAGAVDLEVSVGPGAILLALSASAYDSTPPDAGASISFKLNGEADALVLSMPLLLVGATVLERFVGGPLATLSFTSTLAADVGIEILTVRDAIVIP